MKILLFVLALWAFMSIAPSDGKDVRKYYGPKGTICKRNHHWIVKIKCTNKCKIRHPKAAFGTGRVRITGRMGVAFRQKKKSCGRNCFCTKTSKQTWNQVFCKNHKGKKITSNMVHFDILCLKKTTKLRFRAYVKNFKSKMMKPVKKCPSGQNRHEDGVCRECANKEYKDGTCKPCNCGVKGSKFQSCKTTTGDCTCNAGYKDRDCKTCKDQYYKEVGKDECKACGCNNPGTTNGGKCGADGICTCDTTDYQGNKCDQCKGAGKTKHEDGVCRECPNKQYKDGTCKACACSTKGSKFQSCKASSGDCTCKDGYKDKDCDNCQDKFYKKGDECLACGCFDDGTNDDGKCAPGTGDCSCKANFNTPKCIGCKAQFYYKSATKTCESCGCDPDGSKNNGNCAKDTGDCECKAEAKGAKCVECKAPDHYRPAAGGACKPCNCVVANTVGGAKDCTRAGQCTCVTGKSALDCST